MSADALMHLGLQVPIFSELTDEPDQILPIKSRRKTSKLVNMISVIIATVCLIMTGWEPVSMALYWGPS